MDRIFKAIAILSLSLIIISCGEKKTDSQQVEAERVEIVKTTLLEKTKVARKIELPTTLEGYKTVNISPSITGKIEHIYVEVGSHVNQGDMLVRMDQNQYKTTKLSFENLKIEYERVEALSKTGNISKQTYDQTKLNYDQTQESLDFLETNTFVKAPFKGVISAKNFEDGELFSGSPIVTLTQIHLLKALINIPETYYPYVKEGMPLNISTDIYPDQTFSAIIEIVYPTIDESSHTFSVQIKIPNAKEILRPGMYVHTIIDLNDAETIIVPYQAVLKLTGSNDRYVFLNENGKAKRVSVTLGQRFNEKIEIISSEIKEGDELVTTGQGKLIDGVKLDVQK